MHDTALSRWSNALLWLAYATIIISMITPILSIKSDAPLILIKGTELWKTTLGNLPFLDAVLCITIQILPTVAWMFCVTNIIALARLYRQGIIFESTNTRCFVRIGIGLMMMGILSAIVFPIINYLLFIRGVSPWLADMQILALCEPDLIMAGVLFFLLGKIMQRGKDLEEFDRLTV